LILGTLLLGFEKHFSPVFFSFSKIHCLFLSARGEKEKSASALVLISWTKIFKELLDWFLLLGLNLVVWRS